MRIGCPGKAALEGDPLAEQYEGRLELTWTNKHRRLLAYEDGSYAWVDPSDYRVAEVRLLDDAGTVGEVRADAERAKDNLLIRGDALNALTSLAELPEFASEYVGKVKLVYIDPPFNTGQAFEQYDDGLEHSVWLTMMRDRLLLIKRLLAPDGSVWVHLDDTEMAYCKAVMDDVFGRNAFLATVVWQKRYSRENRAAFGSAHDYILVYAPMGTDWKAVRNRLRRVGAKEYSNPNDDPRGPWRGIPFTAQGFRANQMYPIVAPNGKVHRPSKGRCWGAIESRFKEHLAAGRVYWGKDGNAQPQIIRYLADDEGLVPMTWWPHGEVGHTDEAKKEVLALVPDSEPFATPKPERLMSRIVEIASDPGDLVLDCFAGSGTTAAVAHKLNRRWVTVERSQATVSGYTSPRLQQVVAGTDAGGISTVTARAAEGELPEGVEPEAAAAFVSLLAKFNAEIALDTPDEDHRLETSSKVAGDDGENLSEGDGSTHDEKVAARAVAAYIKGLRLAAKTRKITETIWTGGGGYRVLDVAPSMFEDADGTVVVADWASNGKLAEATAAQLGFAYEPGSPFVGRKAKNRLAVIDGLVNADVARLLVDALEGDELLTLCGTAVDPATAVALRELRRGSVVRKIPASILAEYRRPRWQATTAPVSNEAAS